MVLVMLELKLKKKAPVQGGGCGPNTDNVLSSSKEREDDRHFPQHARLFATKLMIDGSNFFDVLFLAYRLTMATREPH